MRNPFFKTSKDRGFHEFLAQLIPEINLTEGVCCIRLKGGPLPENKYDVDLMVEVLTALHEEAVIEGLAEGEAPSFLKRQTLVQWLSNGQVEEDLAVHALFTTSNSPHYQFATRLPQQLAAVVWGRLADQSDHFNIGNEGRKVTITSPDVLDLAITKLLPRDVTWLPTGLPKLNILKDAAGLYYPTKGFSADAFAQITVDLKGFEPSWRALGGNRDTGGGCPVCLNTGVWHTRLSRLLERTRVYMRPEWIKEISSPKEKKKVKLAKSKAAVHFGYVNYCEQHVEAMGRLEFNLNSHVEHQAGERTYGVEIECRANVKDQEKLFHSATDKRTKLNILGINSHRDGSLHDDKAVEYASPPLNWTDICHWTKEVARLAKPEVFRGCGLHVWVGVEDYSWHEVNKLLVACRKHETAIGKMVPAQRRPSAEYQRSGAPMMLPNYEMHKTRKQFMSQMYGPEVLVSGSDQHRALKQRRANEQGRRNFPNGMVCRYHWLNVHPYWRCKAVEIRLHHGSVDPNEITEWLFFWRQVIENLDSFYKSGIAGLPKRARVYAAERTRQFSSGAKTVRRVNTINPGMNLFATNYVQGNYARAVAEYLETINTTTGGE